MLGGLLQHPYVLAVAVAVLTAAGMYYYTRSIEQDPEKSKKAFFKTLVVGLAAGLGLAYVSGKLTGRGASTFGGGPELTTEPFMPADAVATSGPATVAA